MAVEHSVIPDGERHEPKGISSAPAKRVYTSDGADSGSWDQVDADTLKGLINNSLAAGLRLVTDGSGGIDTEAIMDPAYGSMTLTSNSTPHVATAAADSTLGTNSDYDPLTLGFTFPLTENMVTGSNYLEVVTPGVYRIDFWANVASDTNATVVAVKFVVNDVDFVARRPKKQLPNGDALDNISANGLHTFAAGDQVKLAVASSKSAEILFEDFTFQMSLVDMA